MNKLKQYLKSDKFKDNSQFIIVIGLIIVAVIISFAMKVSKESIVVDSLDQDLLKVEILKVKAKPENIIIKGSAAVSARSLVNLSPQVTGKVVSVSPSSFSGSSFQAKEVLFQIDPADYQFKLDMAKAKLKSTKRDLMLAKADSESAKSEWNLINPNKTAPSLVAKVPQLLAATSAAEAAKAEFEKAQLDLARTSYHYQLPGKVVSSQVEVGQLLQAGQSYGQVYFEDSVEIEIEVRPRQLSWVSVGAPVVIKKGAEEIAAKVERIASSLNPSSRLVQVFIKAHQLADLIVGEFVDVEITGGTVDAAYRVPMECFQDEGFLWIASALSDNPPSQLVLEKFQPEVLSTLSAQKLILASDVNSELRIICKNNSEWQEGRKLEVAK